MRFVFFWLISGIFAASAALAAPLADSGLPIPRFVSLKNEETNVRTGPGTRYPIAWIYRRQNMPVEVIEEFDFWRKIRDAEGATGWVHKMMIDGSRYAMIIGKEPCLLLHNSKADAKPLLKAKPGVIASMMECERDWCRLQVEGRRGWAEKKRLWGVYPDEIFD